MRFMRALLVGLLALALVLPGSAAGRRSMFDRRPRLDDRPKLKAFSRAKRGQRRPRVADRYDVSDRVREQREGMLVPGWQVLPYDYELYYDDGWYDEWSEEGQDVPLQLGPGVLPEPQGGGICYECGERLVETTVAPSIWNDTMYISATDYFQGMGTMAYYDAVHLSAVAVMPDGRWVVIPLGQDHIYLDRQKTQLRKPTAVADGILMVPVRALSDVLGIGVRWDPITRSAILNLPWARQAPQPQ